MARDSARRTRASENGLRSLFTARNVRLRPACASSVTPARARSSAARSGPSAAVTSASPLARARASGFLVREAAEHEPPDARGAGPVTLHGGELDAARLARGEAKGPGAHRRLRARREPPGALDREEGLRERRQERRVRPVEGDLDHVGAHAQGAPREAELRAQVLEVRGDRGGVERRAVVERDPLAQGQGPDALVGGGPGGGEHSFRAQRAGPQPHQRLAHVADDLGGHEVGRPVRRQARRIAERADDDRVDGRQRHERGEDQRGDHGRDSSTSLVAQGLDRVEVGGLARGVPAEEDSRPRPRRRTRSGSRPW